MIIIINKKIYNYVFKEIITTPEMFTRSYPVSVGYRSLVPPASSFGKRGILRREFRINKFLSTSLALNQNRLLLRSRGTFYNIISFQSELILHLFDLSRTKLLLQWASKKLLTVEFVIKNVLILLSSSIQSGESYFDKADLLFVFLFQVLGIFQNIIYFLSEHI